jgi:hypothetical protein
MPDELGRLKLRAQRLELGSTVRQRKRAGLDGAAARRPLSRKRAELGAAGQQETLPIQP